MKGRNVIISVGIDLHTTQFTVYVLVDNNMIIQEAVYPTTEEGYRSLIEWAHKAEEEFKCGVSIAIESTTSSWNDLSLSIILCLQLHAVEWNMPSFSALSSSVFPCRVSSMKILHAEMSYHE